MEWTDEQRDAFGALWRMARANAGLSQMALAEQAGVTQSVVSMLEKGPYAGMRFLDIAKLASFFSLSLSQVAATLGYSEQTVLLRPVLDVLVSGRSAEDRAFIERVVDLVVKGLRV
jgi:DNA-binding XRE family transcriptional regulator